MPKPKSSLNMLVITCIFLMACSFLHLSATTQSPPTLTPAPTLPPTDQPSQAGLGLENENLLAALPAGFKIGYQAQQGNQSITEMVPENETVEEWTSMLTVQVYLGETNTTPAQAQETLTTSWFNACDNSATYPVADGIENGYNFILWQLHCPLNPATRKVEYTYMKAIRGNDSFYLVQVAFRFEPTEADITQWMNYLRDVQVCDSRIPERACP